MIVKKLYSKPEISRIEVDTSISLVMQSGPPGNPGPRGDGGKGADTPFQSPFGDKPFS